jgi:hypothetical protein
MNRSKIARMKRLFVWSFLSVAVVMCPVFSQGGNQKFNLPDPVKKPRFPVRDIAWPANHGQADICLWPDDKIAAVTLSIDDNDAPEFDWWIGEMGKRGWKMTWFVITSYINSANYVQYGTWKDFRRLDSLGHDIESHTVHHQLDQDVLPDSVVDAEYRFSQKAINDSIPGHKCRTVAYPGCLDKPSLAKKYYISGRICSGWADKANEINYMEVLTGYFFPEWNPTGWITEITQVTPGYEEYYRGWFNKFWHRADETTISELDLVKENEASIWVGTFTEAAMYSQEYATASIAVSKTASDSITFSIADSMADSIYTYPLTVKVRVNNNWTEAVATQKGKTIPLSPLDYNGNRYVLVKAVPDQGRVTLKRKTGR